MYGIVLSFPTCIRFDARRKNISGNYAMANYGRTARLPSTKPGLGRTFTGLREGGLPFNNRTNILPGNILLSTLPPCERSDLAHSTITYPKVFSTTVSGHAIGRDRE
jgi:hypothetical protein